MLGNMVVPGIHSLAVFLKPALSVCVCYGGGEPAFASLRQIDAQIARVAKQCLGQGHVCGAAWGRTSR